MKKENSRIQLCITLSIIQLHAHLLLILISKNLNSSKLLNRALIKIASINIIVHLQQASRIQTKSAGKKLSIE